MRRVLCLAALVTLAGCAAAPPRGARTASPRELVGQRIAIAAQDASGRTVRIGEDGAKVRVVDFFASWCEPCREQLPALDKLRRARSGDGVAVYAVAFDEGRPPLDAFLAANPVDLPVLWDPSGAVLSGALGITRLPTTVVLDAEGRVRWVHEGYGPGDDARLDAQLDLVLRP